MPAKTNAKPVPFIFNTNTNYVPQPTHRVEVAAPTKEASRPTPKPKPSPKVAPNRVTNQSATQHSGRNSAVESCEQYREAVQKYFGDQTDAALFVASKESDCRMSAVSRTADYCIFQIHNEPLTANNVDTCARRAWEKYVGGRVGSYNWSAWYAVCTPGSSPQPKYSGIKCF